MARRETTIYLITGILVGMFLIPPILRFLGIPSFDRLLTSLFGVNNPVVLVFLVLALLLVIFWAYKRPK